MTLESVTVYRDRDNSFTLTLTKNGNTLSEANMDAITKFELKHNGSYYNSNDYPDGFVPDNANGQVLIVPNEFGLAAKTDTTEFLVYDGGNYSNGIVWAQFTLVVSGEALIN